MWTYRNRLIHGTGVGPSRVETERVNKLIQAIYQELGDQVIYSTPDTITRPEREVLALPYTTKQAWLGQVKCLYPEKCKEIAEAVVGRLETTREELHHKSQAAGLNIRDELL